MLRLLSALLLAFTFSYGFRLEAQETSTEKTQVVPSSENSVMCRLDKEVRTLRVENMADGKCQAIYTKGGKDQSIGAASTEGSCSEIIQSVRKNLETAKWKCREVKESRVSNLIEM
jgi:hypothetical protein